MDFWIVFYIMTTVVIGGFAVNTLYRRLQTKAAIMTLVLLILIFTFYGLRWFEKGTLKGTTQGQTTWPPIVNMCPDFMVTAKDATGKLHCYDASNTYNLKTSTNPLLNNKSLTIQGFSGQSGLALNDLPTKITDVVREPGVSQIRWEGVWDGGSLNKNRMPKPT
jgi:hypothetical protein